MGTVSALLVARDMKGTIGFYRDLLGFAQGMAFPDPENPEYVDLSKDGMVLMFVSARNAGIGEEERLGVGVTIYMETDQDIDEYCAELKRKGVKIAVDIADEPYGIRDFTVEDLDGYKLTFNQVVKGGKTCLSCGMPMVKSGDFGGENPANPYCVHCSMPDGTLKSYDEVVEGMAEFMARSRGIDGETAEAAARDHLRGMPAWAGRS